ncbi:MAG: SOS response-associated peptidase family protein [Porphyrobacter sp.]|nr:SOS response-associated peptidase family protein [Porphyrobacter sp.]
MCNLTRMTKNVDEVAKWFEAVDGARGANFAAEVYPGYTGLVLAEGTVRPMVWGFPLVLKGKQGQPLKPKPVNNARSDKLATGFWRQAFTHQRCLIPLEAWGEAEGPKGRMTRTWLRVPDSPLFAAAGVWRRSDEWGDCYAMVMTDSAGTEAASVHERMPVLIASADHARWLGGTAHEAFSLCRSWPGPLSIERTAEAWARSAAQQPGLF